MDSLPSKILVADDDRDTADLTAYLLRLAGYDVQTVYGGRQALEEARTFRPDLVILDIEMPGMDGCEAACALRADSIHADLVLVAHTALDKPTALERTCRARFDRYLSKPAAQGALVALAADCLPIVSSRT